MSKNDNLKIGECPKCHKMNVEIDVLKGFWVCPDCGFKWTNDIMQSLVTVSKKLVKDVKK